MQADRRRRPTRGLSQSAGGALVAVVGLGLFLYFVQRAGVGGVVAGVRRLGWVFAIVVALGGVRFLVRAAAWMRCLDAPHRLTLGNLFQAVVVGDALGNLTPLSIVIGEPAKGAFLRDHEPLARTLPALALENLFYTLSAILVIVGGLVTTLLTFRISGQLWLTTTVTVTVMVGLVTIAHWIFWTDARIASSGLRWFEKRGVLPGRIERLAATVERLESRVHALYPRSVAQLVPLAVLEGTFHALAIAEIYLILLVLSDQPPTILAAFIFESTNRFISFAFRFVPLRMGVDEAGSGMFADLLAFGTTTGVTLAIIRKGRILTWIAIGVAVLIRRGLSVSELVSTPAPESTAVVVIMARSPVGGAPPKTRLAPVIPDADDRRRLYAGFLHDTIRACRSLDGVSLRIAFAPGGDPSAFADLGVDASELLGQRGDDLGERERSVFSALFAAGFKKVVMVGSDLPTIPVDHVRSAFNELGVRTKRVVLGPAEDGGYYLMALAKSGAGREDLPDLFSHIRWSTAKTLSDTTAAAARAGLDVRLVPAWYDVDDEDGLARLRQELTDPAIRARAPRTAAILGTLTSLSDPPSPCSS